MKMHDEKTEETGAYDDAVLEAGAIPPSTFIVCSSDKDTHPDIPPDLSATEFLEAYYRNQQ